MNGTPADGYEFYDHENEKTQGTVHLFVAKDTGFPLRIEMVDPRGAGVLHLTYAPIPGPAHPAHPP